MSARVFTALFVALTVGASALAVGPRGGELRHSAGVRLNFDDTTNEVGEAVQLPSFPTQLGRLTGVRVELWLETASSYGVENVSRLPGSAHVQVSESFAVLRSGGAPVIGTPLNLLKFHPFPGFDDEVDFAGPSGTTEEMSFAKLQGVDLPPGRDWTDLGAGQSLTLDLVGLIDFNLTGYGSLESFFEGAATMRVEVIYSYQ